MAALKGLNFLSYRKIVFPTLSLLTCPEDKSAWLHTCPWGKTIYLVVEDTTSGAPHGNQA